MGDRLEGVVAKIGRDAVFIELDGKRQAYMDIGELRAADGTVTVKVGDRIAGQVVEVDLRTGNVRLGRSMGRPGSLAAIEQAREAAVAIEGKVTAVNKGGLEVDLDGVRGFCPISHVDSKYVGDPSVFVGRTLRFLVTDIREGGKNVLLSRRALLEREAREAAARVLKSLVPGAVVRGTVTAVREFGAFVDLGGVEGMIPASEIAHDRSLAVADVVKPGDVVEVQVREVREGAAQGGGEAAVKITLSLKALSPDPWEQIDMVLSEGRVVVGTVTRLVDFGAFVRLAAGVEGMLHVSELGGKVEHPSKVLKVGQSLTVVVKKIDREGRKIALVPAPEGVEAGATVQGPSFVLGMVVTGTVERIEPYGVFVQVEGTVGRAGRGLIPNAELGVPRGADIRKLFSEGMRVTAKVIETGEGRLRLSIRAAREDEERAQFEEYRDRSAAPAKLGTLGDLLKRKGR
uniref:30S ribosomal protein S1 n=1 Tax=uncultured delta proteobacterium TaxID=34034 RepID=H5SLM1_9DELT|nr:30S ribosomal protein S1 [uncultured delta proteobacterium]